MLSINNNEYINLSTEKIEEMLENSRLERDNILPAQIKAMLDEHIIGQEQAKKVMALAFRERYRRMMIRKQKSSDSELKTMQDVLSPSNILLIGPTGVGKTELARCMSRFVRTPFIKVEATKFTEVGYVGKDVEQIVKDLLDIAIDQTKDEIRMVFEKEITDIAEQKVLDLVAGNASIETRNNILNSLKDGTFTKMITVPITKPMEFSSSRGGVLKIIENKTQKKLTAKDAIAHFQSEVLEDLLDEEQVVKLAIQSTEMYGMVFIDEIDKICHTKNQGHEHVSREGVQRDLLPLIEGTTITTKYGPVNTYNILFICAGAFHVAQPKDLLPELQGRLAVHANLNPLTTEDFIKILSQKKASIIKQEQALLAVDKINIQFTDDAIACIAEAASKANQTIENIGARRLSPIIKDIIQDISYDVAKYKNQEVIIDAKEVKNRIKLDENDRLNTII